MKLFRKKLDPETSKRFRINLQQSQRLDKDGAKLLFDHAEKFLKDTHDTNNIIATRTTTLLTLVVGIMVGLTGYVINRVEKIGQFDDLSQTAIYSSVYLLYIAIRLTRNIKPRMFYPLGSPPKPFFESAFLDKKHKDLSFDFYINEIENYQERIDFNQAENEKRWEIFATCLIMTICSPFAVGLLYLLVILLS